MAPEEVRGLTNEELWNITPRLIAEAFVLEAED